MRGANVTPGYWRDERATLAAFTEDGWLRTGDLGEIDGDGFLRLRGRLKDLIVLASGLNVYPEDVERELRGTGWWATARSLPPAEDEGGRARPRGRDPRRRGTEAGEGVAAAVRDTNVGSRRVSASGDSSSGSRASCPGRPAQGEALRAPCGARRPHAATGFAAARGRRLDRRCRLLRLRPRWRRPGLRSAWTATSPSTSPSTPSPASSWPLSWRAS